MGEIIGEITGEVPNNTDLQPQVQTQGIIVG
jgi:hypothetical protein